MGKKPRHGPGCIPFLLYMIHGCWVEKKASKARHLLLERIGRESRICFFFSLSHTHIHTYTHTYIHSAPLPSRPLFLPAKLPSPTSRSPTRLCPAQRLHQRAPCSLRSSARAPLLLRSPNRVLALHHRLSNPPCHRRTSPSPSPSANNHTNARPPAGRGSTAQPLRCAALRCRRRGVRRA